MRILLMAIDPGGINVIASLYSPLIEKGYEVLLVSNETGVNRFKQLFDIEAQQLSRSVVCIDEKSLSGYLKELHLDMVITGTSASDQTEKLVWKCCKVLEISTIAILDQWMNLGIRFSKYAINEFEEYERDRSHECQPDCIMLMDELSKKTLVDLGFDPSKLMVTGQPYFNHLMTVHQQESEGPKVDTKSSTKPLSILFASEPISETQIGSKGTSLWGYTEIQILECFLNALMKAATDLKIQSEIFVIIRPHPKETTEKFEIFMSQYKNSLLSLSVDKESSSYDLIRASDWIVGMSSMFLLEATLFERPVTSIQIGLNQKNPFVLDQLEINLSLTTQEQVENACHEFTKNKSLPIRNWNGHSDALQNVLKGVEFILCRN